MHVIYKNFVKEDSGSLCISPQRTQYYSFPNTPYNLYNMPEMAKMLGAHVSIAGSIVLAPERGAGIGCEVIQMFSKNQRSWGDKPITLESAEKFKLKMKEMKLSSSAAHAAYLINIATAKKDVHERSKTALIDEINRVEQLGLDYLIFHPGSHLDAGLDNGVKMCGDTLKDVVPLFEKYHMNLLIETAAGQGSNIGFRFSDLARIMNIANDSKKIGICVDTCHIFAAGYDIRTEFGYETIFKEIDNVIGLDRVMAFHLNDSKTGVGSHVDRHEHIGKGYIGLKPFELLVNDQRFAKKPMYLETPGDLEDYRKNLELLKKLRKIQ